MDFCPRPHRTYSAPQTSGWFPKKPKAGNGDQVTKCEEGRNPTN